MMNNEKYKNNNEYEVSNVIYYRSSIVSCEVVE